MLVQICLKLPHLLPMRIVPSCVVSPVDASVRSMFTLYLVVVVSLRSCGDDCLLAMTRTRSMLPTHLQLMTRLFTPSANGSTIGTQGDISLLCVSVGVGWFDLPLHITWWDHFW